jgi:hypothetical protein
MRYAQSGPASAFGAPIRDSVMAMQFIASGDLVVLLSGMLGRIDASGRMVDTAPLPIETLVYGFDVDADQCTVVFAGLDKLGLTNICADVPPDFLAVPSNFFDARFLPDGNILAASRGAVVEIDRHATVVRTFITSESDYGFLAIDPDGTSFRTTANNRQFRFDLITGKALGPPAWLRNAVYGSRSMAIRGEWRAALHVPTGRRSMRR